jgi:hypothetical protein
MQQYYVAQKERHCSAGTLIQFAATIEILIYGNRDNDFEM